MGFDVGWRLMLRGGMCIRDDWNWVRHGLSCLPVGTACWT